MSESLHFRLSLLEAELANLPAVIDAATKNPATEEDALTRLWARREMLPHLIAATEAQITDAEAAVARLAAEVDAVRPTVQAAQAEHDQLALAADVYTAAAAHSAERLGTAVRKLRRLELEHSNAKDLLR